MWVQRRFRNIYYRDISSTNSILQRYTIFMKTVNIGHSQGIGRPRLSGSVFFQEQTINENMYMDMLENYAFPQPEASQQR